MEDAEGTQSRNGLKLYMHIKNNRSALNHTQ